MIDHVLPHAVGTDDCASKVTEHTRVPGQSTPTVPGDLQHRTKDCQTPDLHCHSDTLEAFLNDNFSSWF